MNITDSVVAIPPLLLDSDVIYSDSAEKAINLILGEQAGSKEVFVFGGPPSLGETLYLRYVKESIKLIRNGNSPVKFAVMSYLPVNDSLTSTIWLEVCDRLARECPTSFRFGAFTIGDGQLRPFSYQVFDKQQVHIGLRGFNAFRATPTLSSAILLRNPRIAQLFADDFSQSFQAIGHLDTDKHHALMRMLGDHDEVARQQIERTVRVLLA
jgi:hypothetical protein